MTRSFPVVRNQVVNGLQNNVPKFYCDHCNTYLTGDSPPVRKTHCSGRKHRECESLLLDTDGRAGSEPDRQNNRSISAKRDASHSVLSPPPSCGAQDSSSPSLPGPPRPGMMPAPHTGGPPMMPMMGPPPPGMMPGGPAPGMRPPVGGHMPMMPGPPVMRPPARPMMVPTRQE